MSLRKTTPTAAAAAVVAAGSAGGLIQPTTASALLGMTDGGATAVDLGDHGEPTQAQFDAGAGDGFDHTLALGAGGRPLKFPNEEDKEQWSAKRRETHKEVERRRRDTINFGIGELAKIVPDCDKNKGSIVHKAADYIKYLQRTNLVTIEKWRDEKKETDDKIKALQEQVERLERELEVARAANEPKRRKGDS